MNKEDANILLLSLAVVGLWYVIGYLEGYDTGKAVGKEQGVLEGLEEGIRTASIPSEQ